jgi:alkylhydroperoxidase/carboxymuconolactone decarboxylase family protein YurZ
MLEDEPISESRALLRRLAANDEGSVRTVLAPSQVRDRSAPRSVLALDRKTRWLVHLAALLVVDASTESLRWAADLACTSGADDGAIAAVLIAAGSAAGSAQVVAAAPRLAEALGLEPAEGAAPH